MDASGPPVAQLLRHEAAAWESLLQLQTATTAATAAAAAAATVTTAGAGGGVGTGQGQVQGMPPQADQDGGHNSPHSRAYLSSLTHLAACGDALVAEALKLRSLRNARDSLESSMYRHVVVHHQQQFYKCGEAAARSVTNDLLQATSELRNEVARARTELTQLRSAVEALNSTSLRLPASAAVVIGLRYAEVGSGGSGGSWGDRSDDDEQAADGNDDGSRGGGGGGGVGVSIPPRPPLLQTVDEFLRRCLSHSDGTRVTDEALAAALLQSPPPGGGAEQQNTFRRRKT